MLYLLVMDGYIPSELCNSTSMSINVSDTGINCYSGCLTSSQVLIYGASDNCHDGSVMREFLILVGIIAIAVVFSTMWHRVAGGLVPYMCSGFASCFNLSDGGSGQGVQSWLSHWLEKYHISFVLINLSKVLLALVLTVGLNAWWSYGAGDDSIVDSCSNSIVGNCASFCLF